MASIKTKNEILNFILLISGKQKAPHESTSQELSFEWSHSVVSSTDFRTLLSDMIITDGFWSTAYGMDKSKIPFVYTLQFRLRHFIATLSLFTNEQKLLLPAGFKFYYRFEVVETSTAWIASADCVFKILYICSTTKYIWRQYRITVYLISKLNGSCVVVFFFTFFFSAIIFISEPVQY